MIPLVLIKTRATVAVDEMTRTGNTSANFGFYRRSKKKPVYEMCVGALLFYSYVLDFAFCV